MIRYAALLLIAAACAATGFSLSRRLRQRLQLLEAFVYSLERLQSEIGYMATPLAQAVCSINAIEPFWQAFARGLKQGESTAQAFCEAERELSFGLLGDEAQRSLRRFAQRLGKGTRAEETANIARTLEELAGQVELARTELTKKGKLYKGIGVLSGLAVVIVLI